MVSVARSAGLPGAWGTSARGVAGGDLPGAGGRVAGAAGRPHLRPLGLGGVRQGDRRARAGLSTVSGTGWKPLAVLFTAPLALFGTAGPSLWLVVVRCAGLVAMLLAFRLSARVGGVAGMLAALALLACSQWLRFLSAGNVEPFVVALLLGAIELHLRGRRGAAFLLGALAGLGRPEVWLLVAGYAGFVCEPSGAGGRWPSASRPCSRCGSCPTGSARVTRCTRCTVHSSAASRLPCSAAATRGSSSWAAPSASPRHRCGSVPLSALVLGWRTRNRTVGALAFVVFGWTLPTVVATALGYPAVPRYLVEPAAVCCVLAGIGLVGLARLLRGRRSRAALPAPWSS